MGVAIKGKRAGWSYACVCVCCVTSLQQEEMAKIVEDEDYSIQMAIVPEEEDAEFYKVAIDDSDDSCSSEPEDVLPSSLVEKRGGKDQTLNDMEMSLRINLEGGETRRESRVRRISLVDNTQTLPDVSIM